MLTKLRRWLSSRRALNQELNTVYRRLAEEKLRADQMTEQHRTVCRMSKSASTTLQHLGYTDCGGEQWKPPIGPTPDFEKLDKKQRVLDTALAWYKAHEENDRVFQEHKHLAVPETFSEFFGKIKPTTDRVSEAFAEFKSAVKQLEENHHGNHEVI